MPLCVSFYASLLQLFTQFSKERATICILVERFARKPRFYLPSHCYSLFTILAVEVRIKWCRIYVTNETRSNFKNQTHILFLMKFSIYHFPLTIPKELRQSLMYICKARQRVKNCNYCHSKLHTKQSETKFSEIKISRQTFFRSTIETKMQLKLQVQLHQQFYKFICINIHGWLCNVFLTHKNILKCMFQSIHILEIDLSSAPIKHPWVKNSSVPSMLPYKYCMYLTPA